MDLVIEGNRIARIQGTTDPSNRSEGAEIEEGEDVRVLEAERRDAGGQLSGERSVPGNHQPRRRTVSGRTGQPVEQYRQSLLFGQAAGEGKAALALGQSELGASSSAVAAPTVAPTIKHTKHFMINSSLHYHSELRDGIPLTPYVLRS